MTARRESKKTVKAEQRTVKAEQRTVTGEQRTVTAEQRTVKAEPRPMKADSLLQSFELTRNTYIRIKKGKQKNTANYTQTLHSILHRADSPSVAKCIVCVPNYTQTIHKLCIKPYIEAFQTLHSERPKPYTTASKPYTEPSTEHHVEV